MIWVIPPYPYKRRSDGVRIQRRGWLSVRHLLGGDYSRSFRNILHDLPMRGDRRKSEPLEGKLLYERQDDTRVRDVVTVRRLGRTMFGQDGGRATTWRKMCERGNTKTKTKREMAIMIGATCAGNRSSARIWTFGQKGGKGNPTSREGAHVLRPPRRVDGSRGNPAGNGSDRSDGGRTRDASRVARDVRQLLAGGRGNRRGPQRAL